MSLWPTAPAERSMRMRGGFGFVSIGLQGNPGLYRTAVAFKNKPAPDDPVPAWIFPEPITIVARWLRHWRNMIYPVAKFQTGRSPIFSNGPPLPLSPQFHDLPSLRRLELISSRQAVLASSRHRWPMHPKTPR